MMRESKLTPNFLLMALSIQIIIGLSILILPFPWIMFPYFGIILLGLVYWKPIVGYLALIPFLPNYGISLFNITRTMDVSLLEPAVLLAIVSWMFLTIRQKTVKFYLSPSDTMLFILYGWIILSIFWTPAQFRSIQQILKILIGLSIYLVSINMIRNKSDLNITIATWIMLGIFVSLIGIYEFATEGLKAAPGYVYTEGYDKIHRDVRTTTLFRGADMVGFLTSLCIIIIIVKYVVVHSKKEKILLLAALALVSFVFLTAISRKSYLALAVAFAYMSYRSKKIFRLCVAAGGISLVVMILLIPTGFADAVIERLKSFFMSPEEAISARAGTWLIAWEFFTKSPLIGNGIGSFYGYATAMNSPLQFEHNFYLFVLVEVGIVGFTLLLLWVLHLGYRFVEFSRVNTDEEAQIISVGITAGLIAIMITMGFRSFSLTDPTFWGFMGLASAFLQVYSPINPQNS